MNHRAEEISQVELEPLTRNFMWSGGTSRGSFVEYLRNNPLYLELPGDVFVRADFRTFGAPRMDIDDNLQFPINLGTCALYTQIVGDIPTGTDLPRWMRELFILFGSGRPRGMLSTPDLRAYLYFDQIEGSQGQKLRYDNVRTDLAQDFAHLGLSALLEDRDSRLGGMFNERFAPPLPAFRIAD